MNNRKGVNKQQYEKWILYPFDSNLPRLELAKAFATSFSSEELPDLNLVSFTTDSQHIFFAFESMEDRLTTLLLGKYDIELFIPLEEGQAFFVAINTILSMEEIKKIANDFRSNTIVGQ